MVSFLEHEPVITAPIQETGYRTIDLNQAFFPVAQKPLFFYDANNLAQASGQKALMALDTQEILYVGPEYTPVLNQDVYEALTELEQYGWQASKIRTLNRRVFTFSYVNPNITLNIGGQPCVARLVVTNSYDGSHALKILIGAYIKVCFNGLVIGKGVEYKKKHISGIGDFKEVLNTIGHKGFKDTVAKAESKQWEYEDVTKLQNIWKSLVKSYPNASNGQPNKLVYALNQRFAVEQQAGYKGEFAMLMAATHLVTHEAHLYSGTYMMQLEKDIPKVFFNN